MQPPLGAGPGGSLDLPRFSHALSSENDPSKDILANLRRFPFRCPSLFVFGAKHPLPSGLRSGNPLKRAHQHDPPLLNGCLAVLALPKQRQLLKLLASIFPKCLLKGQRWMLLTLPLGWGRVSLQKLLQLLPSSTTELVHLKGSFPSGFAPERRLKSSGRPWFVEK